MATQGQISITNTNLSGGSYSFEIYVRACGSGNWGSPIDTIPYSGFPYYFNVESILTGSPSCYEYLVEEPTTQAQCTGQVIFTSPTPTPTKTKTPTPTPTVTPPITSGVSLSIYSTFSEGSLLANYFLERDQTTTVDTYYQFQNKLATTGGSEIDLIAYVEIPQGATTGQTTVQLPFNSLNEIDPGYSVISNFVSTSEESVVVDRYAGVIFEGRVIPTIRVIFAECCNLLPNIQIQVPTTATDTNSQNPWVLQGGVIQYQGNCYKFLQFGGNASNGFFAGPDASSCGAEICPSCNAVVSPSPTRTATRTPTITPTNTKTPTLTPTNTPSPTPPCADCDSNVVDCAEVMGCYSYPVAISPTPTRSATPTPTVTSTLTPTLTPTPSVTPTNLECLDDNADGYIFDSPQ